MIHDKISGDGGSSVMFSIKVLDTMFSLQKPSEMKDFTKSSLARLRQENVIIHVGNTALVHMRSLLFHRVDENIDCENFEIVFFKYDPKKTKSEVIQIDREQLR